MYGDCGVGKVMNVGGVSGLKPLDHSCHIGVGRCNLAT